MKIYLFVVITIFLLTACSDKNTTPIKLNFALTYQNHPISCEPNTTEKLHFSLSDFRLYLHNIELQDQQNQWHQVKLTNNQWQNDSTALLDFENASDDCASGNEPTNTQISGLSIDNPKAVRFTLGVPFELNHQNPLTAKAPLNESTMHWHWQSGYKFLRAEFKQQIQQENEQQANLRLHIGSLQCKGEVNNISHCEKPNRTTYTIDDFDINQNITIAIDKIIDFYSQSNNLTCMGNNERPWCANALQWAGLDDNKAKSNMFIQTRPAIK